MEKDSTPERELPFNIDRDQFNRARKIGSKGGKLAVSGQSFHSQEDTEYDISPDTEPESSTESE